MKVFSVLFAFVKCLFKYMYKYTYYCAQCVYAHIDRYKHYKSKAKNYTATKEGI